MFDMSVPWWELVLRSIVVYLFLLVFLRLTGRRQTGQYAPFDLVLLLILSNAVQNSMNAGDNSLVGGLISLALELLDDARGVFDAEVGKQRGHLRRRDPHDDEAEESDKREGHRNHCGQPRRTQTF